MPPEPSSVAASMGELGKREHHQLYEDFCGLKSGIAIAQFRQDSGTEMIPGAQSSPAITPKAWFSV